MMDTSAHNDKSEAFIGLPHLCGSCPKGRDLVQVQISEYRNKPIIDCRLWYTATDGELRPGPKGLTLTLDALPRLSQAILEAVAYAKANGMLSKGGAA
jgi:hypothetical protein